MEPLLDIRNLSLEFRTPRGRVKALRDVSFPIRKNRIVGIVGESGSGKSTVLWAIMGLLASNAEVTDGKIMFQGRDLLALDEALSRLEQHSPRLASVVEGRFFGGMTEVEIGEWLGVTDRTVRTDWRKARAWLVRELRDDGAAA